MTIQEYQRIYAPRVEEQLFDFLNKWEESFLNTSSRLEQLATEFKRVNAGGKRIRGVLCILGYEIGGGKDFEEITKVAAALELFQTSILAHDDIIDNSELRRGKPTLFSSLGFDHYALSQTICLADLGFFMAVRIIAECNFPESTKNLVIRLFSQVMYDTAVGEMLDIELPAKKIYNQTPDVLTIMTLKTAKYTISGPLKMGLLLSGVKDQTSLKSADIYGDNLGIAFQIQDDILGIYGSEAEMGKSNISDIQEGKATILASHAFNNATSGQKAKLQRYYGNPALSDGEAEIIRKIFKECGALEHATSVAVQYSETAVKSIPKVTTNKRYQQLLTGLAEYLINRNK